MIINSPPPLPPPIMAASPPPSSSFPLLAAAAAAMALLMISPASSQTCKSQALPQTNTKFTHCTDLPTLKAQIHWAYDPSAKPGPTLSIAYVAPPARPDGWVAWALNPTGSGMIGAQALVAFRDGATDGSAVVKTYNISSYGPISESRIAYEVLSKRAEYSGGVITIFAVLVLPSGRTAVNQVWQVGASVKDGVPVRHDLSEENLGSKGTLQLGGGGAAADQGQAEAPAPASDHWKWGPEAGDNMGPSWRMHGSGMGWHGVLVLLGVILSF